ncbi:MAG: 4-(cytidine 5'-diphospho)-2-C-methyl-D-erythritol kinase [Flavobacteriales bacterium]|nr:4-(cytidine 5'-diphospho)-2-C-methyl-D-erythritol kinase [Flavobacteriales bacterium]
MLAFPFAKINLGLQVLGKRPDGYHDIRSVLFPIPLHDALEAVVDNSLPLGDVKFESTGLPVPGDPQSNLCLQAVELFRQQRELPGLRMHLHKAIPTGAGLGGGSSDGTHTLHLLNKLLDLRFTPEELHTIAARLGSDCPFFLKEQPQLAEGRGERLSPVEVDLKNHWLVLVNPGIHVSTAEVFQGMQVPSTHADLVAALKAPLEAWPGTVVNDLETYVFAKHPAIGAIKEELLNKGAVYAAMSGSGSSVFGIFTEEPSEVAFLPEYRSWVFPI